MYNHGTVIGAKITVSGTNTDQLKDFIICLGVRSDSTSTGLPIEEAMEDQHSHYILVQGGNKTARNWRISHKFSASKYFGRPKKAIIGAADYRESASTLPNEAAYFYLRFYPKNPLDSIATQYFTVAISYHVVMTEPKAIGLS